MQNIQLLDCTLRDGCYIVDSKFTIPIIKGIINKLSVANVDIIECGWLKDKQHEKGTAYYHFPEDVIPYLPKVKNSLVSYALMMDWNRYNLDLLPKYSTSSIDTIRIAFPYAHYKEALPLGYKVLERGYKLIYQAANTLAYTENDLKDLVSQINKIQPEALSIVDTFGAMYPEDLERIFYILDESLDSNIKLGFHSHNNQQLSFALSMEFLKLSQKTTRSIMLDSSLCGMGRGAGNTTTELLANYLNKKYHGNYDMNEIMDTIDLYLTQLATKYQWGYSIPYFIAGIYSTHVNNIAYLLNNHRTLSKDMRLIIESMQPESRIAYDYNYLEQKYIQYQNKIIDDSQTLDILQQKFQDKDILLLGPGNTLITHQQQIEKYRANHSVITIGINAIPQKILCDYYFFVNPKRYLYAQETSSQMNTVPIILTSNIKRTPLENEYIINYNQLYKLGWQYFDNACIMGLRLMSKLHAHSVCFAGFDGFPEDNTVKHFYIDNIYQPELTIQKRKQINQDVLSMLQDFFACDKSKMKVSFITPSRFSLNTNA